MMSTSSAIAYTATPGYLFQTMLSAVQARQNVSHDVRVHVVALETRGESQPELAAMASVAVSHGIDFHRADLRILDELHPVFGRLFLDQLLPAETERVLYLDGDTQISGSLEPLLDRPLARGHLAGVMDPMTAVRRSHLPLRWRIDRAWDAAHMPTEARLRYVNSGVLMFPRSDLADFRKQILAAYTQRGSSFTHADQDAINLALWDRIEHLELEWNYPGFLLGVQGPARDRARIVHFMSNPRPWQGAYLPWGRAGHKPYADLVRLHPELRRYWEQPGPAKAARNYAQQIYKSRSEGKIWRSEAFRESLELVYPLRLGAATDQLRQSAIRA